MRYTVEYTLSVIQFTAENDEEAIRWIKSRCDPDNLPSPQPAIIRDETGREVKRVLV